MEYSSEQLIILSAQERNILPVTSACNFNCLFCSHQYNPAGIEVFNCGHRTLEQIKGISDFLNPEQKIVIGESITRIIEGEPFSNPNIIQILTYLRKRFPQTVIQITTNGSYLDLDKIKLIDNLDLIELNLSLNSANPVLRKRLMADKSGEIVLEGVRNLAKFKIPYHGSIVAMPMISNWDDIEEAIKFLDDNQAKTVRIFLPGYTKLTPAKLQFDLNLWTDLIDYIDQLNQKYKVPITVEPPLIQDLNVNLQGVITDSSAANAGLRKGDQILSINQTEVKTRVEAFNRLLKSGFPEIKYERDGEIKETELNKQANESSGIVLDYDISLSRLNKVKEIITKSSANKVLIFTSKLAKNVVDLGIDEFLDGILAEVDIKVISVKNRYFGGSIMAAGLLVVDDFLVAFNGNVSEIKSADLILLPENPFNNWGYDLVGKHYENLEEVVNCLVTLV
ncbi:DUF512 domain-containing protein [Selenihalanaerobacter shriftii]|uniref:4Fe-4S single cluster domain-containing protein n=1 Tax=Selenihalanaerobacter shriftii TaxID=142842 RepID=A0A1T4JVK7_9FIRM|nr:DUF512 domain-containing protein [Selenihalanaerobacter shriftii]SJZ34272.1 4Fe-4S single cluster domain-containing protein [Selenihalanaerobacter shriftii]